MPKPETIFQYNYEDIFELCEFSGKSYKAGMNRIYAEKSRGFNPHSLKSVLLFIARHGSPELKSQILQSSFDGTVQHRVNRQKAAKETPAALVSQNRDVPFSF